jgi:hypothetical protein
MLYPFLGLDTAVELDPARRGQFADYLKGASSIFAESSLASADVAVLPYSWKHTLHDAALRRRAVEYARVAVTRGKRVLVFFDSDSDAPVPLPGALVFRTSLYRSRRRPNEFALPGWGQVLLGLHAEGRLPIRPKVSPPTVSFCGYAPPLRVPLGRTKAKESVRWLLERTGLIRLAPVQPGHYARVEAMRALQRQRGVRTAFIVRPAPSFGADGRLLPGGTAAAAPRWQREYLHNLLDSDYVLCARGFGNYSYRLYEALSCGRIPLLIDTDTLLPFNEQADWRSVLVTVDGRRVRQAGSQLLAAHAAMSTEEFTERQLRCRAFWQRWIAPDAFFRRLAGQLRTPGMLDEEPVAAREPHR